MVWDVVAGLCEGLWLAPPRVGAVRRLIRVVVRLRGGGEVIGSVDLGAEFIPEMWILAGACARPGVGFISLPNSGVGWRKTMPRPSDMRFVVFADRTGMTWVVRG